MEDVQDGDKLSAKPADIKMTFFDPPPLPSSSSRKEKKEMPQNSMA